MLIYMGAILLIAVIVGIVSKRKHTNIKVKLTGRDIHNRNSILNMQDQVIRKTKRKI